MEEYKERDLTKMEKIDEIYDRITNMGEKERKKLERKEKKKLKIPRRAKTSKSRRKKGWCGILFLNENKNISGQKVKLEGGTYETKDKNYHVTDGHEIVFWEGKWPILWQRYDKTNPTNLSPKEGDKNEIYGQDLIKLRMKRDVIKEKKKGGMSMIVIIAILVGGYFIVKAFFPGLFGG